MLKSLFQIIFTLSMGLQSLSASDELVHANDNQEKYTLQWKWAMESLDAFPFDKDDKVLDLRCGNGSITAVVAAKVPSGMVVGLDISETILADARENYQSPNIIYMQGDARNLPFVAQFDKVVALLALNRINEQEQALNSLYKALKPNGKAIITRPGKQPSNLGPLAHALTKTYRWAQYFSNFEQKKQYYNAKEYTLLLENAGFVIEKISQESTYTHFKDREAVVGFFRPLCNFIDHLSPSLQSLFVDEIVDAVLEANQILPDGSILLHDFKLEAIVFKPIS
ncbi:MAG: methyltransferase domain-containing protein [Parachlamydiaceae bacterium]|nr:methyltransferase domain-containing protein [Parachlamydiaceae bacterium]